MPIITLLTDFGVEDEYVGVMKGVMLSINPSATIVDISHQVSPQNLIQAALIVQSTYQYFPSGTIHMVVVDPGVGGGRDILVFETGRHIFVAPNNGVLSLLLEREDPVSVTLVGNPDYYLKPVSQTFHGRDIFAPVAAHISSGVDLRQLGPPTDPDKIFHLSVPRSYISKTGELLGEIVAIDHFGNLMTNIEKKRLETFCPQRNQDKVLVGLGNSQITGISSSYDGVAPKMPLAIIGSRGYLEIAVNKDNAEKYFSANIGDTVGLKLPD
jgi:S-adenosylmethionine hydrolase